VSVIRPAAANLVAAFIMVFSFMSHANGDPEAGKAKSLICSACHGSHGVSPNSLWPNLAGQHEDYIRKQLQYFKTGKQRNAAMMAPMVATLDAQDIADLAAYYTKLPNPKPIPTPTPSARGKQLYRQGDASKQIPACITCHGPDGRGNASAGFPVIAHQQIDYTIQQLQAFKSGERSTDPMAIMRMMSAKLSAEDMRAVAEYLAEM
jgi:cytochrome c553